MNCHLSHSIKSVLCENFSDTGREKEGGKRQREQVMREKERQAGVSEQEDSDRDSLNSGSAAASAPLRTTSQHLAPLASLPQSRVLITTMALAGQPCPAQLCARPSLI